MIGFGISLMFTGVVLPRYRAHRTRFVGNHDKKTITGACIAGTWNGFGVVLTEASSWHLVKCHFCCTGFEITQCHYGSC